MTRQALGRQHRPDFQLEKGLARAITTSRPDRDDHRNDREQQESSHNAGPVGAR